MSKESKNIHDNYVAWCRYKGSGKNLTIETCDSDTPGAFRVYKETEMKKLSNALEKIHALTIMQNSTAMRQIHVACHDALGNDD